MHAEGGSDPVSNFERTLEKVFKSLGLALLGAVLFLVITRAFGVTWTAQWEFWSVMTAAGTVGATVIALWLAGRGVWRERDEVARVVSAWVSDEFLERDDAPAYRRRVAVHLANESNEPIFNARVNVIVSDPELHLGPLTVPPIISVLPPRRELTFDVSVPLRAHADTWLPRVELYFSDPRGRRWQRTALGALRDVTDESSTWSLSTTDFDERQFGLQDSLENPMLIAVSFLRSLQDEDVASHEFGVALAPEAEGWATTDWEQLRAMLDGFNPTSMVDYVTPNIARIKLVKSKELESRYVVGEGMVLEDLKYMTLTRSAANGWRIFSVGGTNRPEEIPLPPDAFL